MRKTNEGASPVRPVLFGAAVGLLATLVLMLVCAVLVHQRTLGEELIPTISLACLAVGCMLASFLAARRLPDGRLAIAVAGGPVVFLILLAACSRCRSPSDSVAQPSVCSVQSRLRCSALLPASICVQKTNTVI